jgi:hypothetical protein
MRFFTLLLVAMLMFVPFALAAPPSSSVQGSWREALQDHLRRHPGAKAADVYKFIHQSVFGPAHLIEDPAGARAYLKAEMAGMGAVPAGESLLENLGGDPALVRVNLRPFLAQGLDSERLLAALVHTANAVTGVPAEMLPRLREGSGILRERGREAVAIQLEILAEEQARKGFEALHHSKAYRAAYHPAYRVILADLARPLTTGP